MKIRAFFALTLPDAVVRWLADHADTLCEFDRKMEVQWVDSENYHLTLSFLGDITLDQVDRLEAVARERLQDVTSLQIHINDTRYYRVNKKNALVAAIPLHSDELIRLHDATLEIAESADVECEDRDFMPHITLGRIPGKKSNFQPPEMWPEVDLISLADSVVLFQSKPGERGSIYTPLFEIPLQDLA
ncbi:RNA 2',3'-cyclic phosphodiesterase [Marinobacterium jannaschii]|uniref:RNA 2',3'-cyclic phosphodiesterase n=1 Tax=Marinobacterium jannaschii TaxID=64970 RepID=UPI00048980C3|nr:RNA 2',3'-cyclic phosphodiesterase [Marinobacterium jannaschii]